MKVAANLSSFTARGSTHPSGKPQAVARAPFTDWLRNSEAFPSVEPLHTPCMWEAGFVLSRVQLGEGRGERGKLHKQTQLEALRDIRACRCSPQNHTHRARKEKGLHLRQTGQAHGYELL